MSLRHWDEVWESRRPDEVSWHQQDPAVSLRLIESVTGPRASVVDVGGGASTLVDGLLQRGYSDVAVLDVAAASLAAARARLGDDADGVAWVVGDVLDEEFGRRFDLWHDRAVLHFLTEEQDRARYRQAVLRAVEFPGNVVLAAFGSDGPEQCSGLPVRRYDRDAMGAVLGEDFEPVEFVEELHTTPTGASQQFLYGVFRRVSASSA